MTSFRIRLARLDEREALTALQIRASLANEGDREAVLAHLDEIVLPAGQIAAGQVFVAETCGAVVGFAAVLARADGDVELDGLFVEPDIWKSGIGRRLIEHASGYARAHGAAALHVLGNGHALGFYGACGFEAAGVEATPFGPPGHLMRRRL